MCGFFFPKGLIRSDHRTYSYRSISVDNRDFPRFVTFCMMIGSDRFNWEKESAQRELLIFIRFSGIVENQRSYGSKKSSDIESALLNRPYPLNIYL